MAHQAHEFRLARTCRRHLGWPLSGNCSALECRGKTAGGHEQDRREAHDRGYSVTSTSPDISGCAPQV